MERLDFSDKTSYNAVEAAIHLNRYAMAKPFCRDANVLDAACGEGYGSFLLKKWGAESVGGVDIDAAAIEKACSNFKNDGLKYIQNDVQKLPFEDHVFDLVVSLETLEHVDDAEMFLREIKRVLKPGGTIILSCPNDPYYYERDNIKNPFHKRTYTFYEFKEMAERELGSYVDYFLSFALDGFINLPFERRTEPEHDIRENAFGMFHHVLCDHVLCVPQERYLNQWNSNYYVGIWGGGSAGQAYRYSAVVAPRETFIDHKDVDYDLLHHLEDICREMDILCKEKEENQQNYRENEEEVTKLKLEHERQMNENHHMKSDLESLNMVLERLKLLLELRQKERDQAQLHMYENWEYYQQSLSQLNKMEESNRLLISKLNEIESSRGMRLLRKYYAVCNWVKRILRR